MSTLFTTTAKRSASTARTPRKLVRTDWLGGQCSDCKQAVSTVAVPRIIDSEVPERRPLALCAGCAHCAACKSTAELVATQNNTVCCAVHRRQCGNCGFWAPTGGKDTAHFQVSPFKGTRVCYQCFADDCMMFAGQSDCDDLLTESSSDHEVEYEPRDPELDWSDSTD